MTAERFVCSKEGRVSRSSCDRCFSRSAERSRLYLSRAICASVHGRVIDEAPTLGLLESLLEKTRVA